MEKTFAIQALSRFVVSYRLITMGSMSQAGSVMVVCNPGQSFEVDVQDISLTSQKDRGRWKMALAASQASTASTVLDSFLLVRPSHSA